MSDPVPPTPQPQASPEQPSAYPPPAAYPGYPWAPPAGSAQGHPPQGHPGYPQGQQGYGQAPAYPAAPAYSPVPPAGSPTFVGQPAYGGPLSAPSGGKGLGYVALVAGILALVGSSIVVAIAAYMIGTGAASALVSNPPTTEFDWDVLAPVRDWVFVAELSFWSGTILGLWALVQGIIAIVKNRGRGAGIAAVVLAAFAPVAFALALYIALTVGLTAGAGFAA